MTDAMIVAARAVHFASAMLLFGLGVFALAVATPVWRRALDGGAGDEARRLSGPALRCFAWTLAASLASGAVWLGLQSAVMSGLPLPQAMDRETLGAVLGKTLFGRLWIGRFGLLLALACLLPGLARATRARAPPGATVVAAVALAATLVAAAFLATLAWSGHAAGAQVAGRDAQLVADVVHLLAAGAWLGALPGLLFLLGRAQPLDVSAEVVRRFSTLGMISVGALVASGLVNAWVLVGGVPAWIGTNYGRLLLAKLALFAVMLGLAAANRFSLTARLAAGDAAGVRALQSLRRNARIEIAVGLVVVAIVGALGVMAPAVHQSPSWPFAHTLSWRTAALQTVGAGAAVVAACAVACIAAGVALGGLLHRRWRLGLAGLAACIAADATWGWMLAVPAYPTTYALAPERYAAGAVMRGADLYDAACRVCHGLQGRGDGPAAATPGVVPTDLAAHASGHRAGDLFWWIAHGIPGTPMPAFSPRLADADIWDLVQFLRAQSDGATAAAVLGEHAQPWVSAIAAPDFTFERAGAGQEALRQPPAQPITLLVFYPPTQSLPYLRALGAQAAAFTAIGLRVLAVPLRGPDAAAGAEDTQGGMAPVAAVQADVQHAYALYARREGDVAGASPVQMDYLIDRQGYLRARWIGVPDAPAARAAAVFDQADLLSRERQRAPLAGAHLH